ncbi:ABC transporter substrate-binding protein [Streptomyces sp. TP-A0874]|uniref:ABC transporter substrate-binding protein n=1 Tax=Streptomyces sp. TP-A0874 TaxID=549819 RepID=UPI000853AAC6|nr:ABC transporter substrate-binding protein [Streptomyces sp. TP-A0874]
MGLLTGLRQPFSRRSRAVLALLALAPVALALADCGYGSKAEPDGAAGVVADGPRTDGLEQVRIGYFGNLTHATALVGDEKGMFQRELGGTEVSRQIFNAGPSLVEALNAGSIDIGWVGPSPAVNSYTQSEGRNLRIVSGSASGGVSLVVDPRRVPGVEELRGKRIATPQLGNTQDVALLHYLSEKGFEVDPTTGRGEVTVVRVDNKETPTLFRQGRLDGAWVPEPTASQLVAAGGKVLIDERDLWSDGEFVITNVVVSQKFLREHPRAVEAVLRGSVRTNAWIESHPAEAKQVVNRALRRQAGGQLPKELLDSAFRGIEVSDDPLASTLEQQAEHGQRAGLLDRVLIDGIYDLRLLNKVLREEGQPAVSDAGLGIGAAEGGGGRR